MKRTIAAILAADVAGYSRLIAEDEEDTLRRLSAAKGVFRREVAAFGGRVFNTAGDAILAEFPSAVEALRAGLAIQGGLNALDKDDPSNRRVRFRMGLTIGDVVEVDGDLLGDGVNIAARLEGIADPGGICIARTVHEAVAGKSPVAFRDVGPQKLKNIPRPIHAFKVVMPDDPAGAAAIVIGLTRRAKAARWVAGAAIVLIGIGLGLVWLLRPELLTFKPVEPALADADPGNADRDDLIAVSVTRARNACFQDTIRVSGVVVPRREVEVKPESEGLRVLRVLAKPLEEVRAGQVLAQLARPGAGEQGMVALRSPVAGLVVRADATAEQPASAQAPPLFQLVANGEFELEAEAPLASLARIAPGQTVTITPLGEGERQGRVRRVFTDLDPRTQLGRVRIGLGDAPGETLRQGQFASGVIRVGERCGVAVPHAAVTREAEGPVIFVANTRRIEARPVATGLSSEGEIEIRTGLEERDTVVVRAGAFLREGDVIRPIPVAAGRR